MNYLLRLKKIVTISTTMMLTLVILLGNVRSAVAQDNWVATGGNAHIAPSPAQGPSDGAELDSFLSPLLANLSPAIERVHRVRIAHPREA